MIEELKRLNPDIHIYSVFDDEFRNYGRIVENIDTKELIRAAKQIEFPKNGVRYLPSVESLEKVEAADVICNEVFGTLPTEIGYCWDYNSLLNATEWHMSSEINIAVTPIVLILGDRRKIRDGKIDSSDFCAFLVPEGACVEIYSTTLHYTPCMTSDKGFGCVVGLPRDTNVALGFKVNDIFMTGRNKWLIAHVENEAKIKQGAFAGIYGKNLEIRYSDDEV